MRVSVCVCECVHYADGRRVINTIASRLLLWPRICTVCVWKADFIAAIHSIGTENLLPYVTRTSMRQAMLATIGDEPIHAHTSTTQPYRVWLAAIELHAGLSECVRSESIDYAGYDMPSGRQQRQETL